MPSQFHRTASAGRSGGPLPGVLSAVSKVDDPGTGAWVRLEIAPCRRTVSGRPQEFVVARATWKGSERAVTIDPVIACVIAAEFALVAAGIARHMVLAAML